MKTRAPHSKAYSNLHALLTPEEHEAIDDELRIRRLTITPLERRESRAKRREFALHIATAEEESGSGFEPLRSPPRPIIHSKAKSPKKAQTSQNLELPFDSSSDTSFSPSDSDCNPNRSRIFLS